MWLLYQLAMGGGLLLAAPYLLARRGRHYLETLAPRLGRHRGEPLRGALWLHAVSVGEIGVAATLARALPSSLPLLVTTVTPTGQARARALFGGSHAAVTYLPFDLGFAVRGFFRRYAPAALVLVEGDYWPLVLRAAARRGLPVAVVNGRLSDRSYPRLRRWRRLLGPLFGAVERFGVQTEEDRRRLLALGVDGARVTTTGNLKYESAAPPPAPELAAAVRRLAAGRPILVAGSTMAGEEELVLEAFGSAGGGERALLVIAPRHPERWDGVAQLLAERGARTVRRSALGAREEAAGTEVLLLDSLGELAALYAVADAAFIGGTLVPCGGHNPLEPARFAVPTVVGPSMENFREIARAFDAADAWRQVTDAGGLARTWRRWLADRDEATAVGRRAAALLEAHRGALPRTLELLAPLLGRVAVAAAAGEERRRG